MAPSAVDRVKLMVGIQPEQTGALSMEEIGCQMTYRQRLWGFVSCYAIGTLLTFVSWFLVFSPGPFAVIFTFGSIVGLCSSMFLCGPKKQWANMTNKTRIGCAATFVFFIIMTLVCALGIKTVIGTIFCAFCQYLALIWYDLSYIPFARQAVWKILSGATSGLTGV